MSVQVKCPKCQQELTAKEHSLGRTAVCPKCRTRFPIAPAQKAGDLAAEPPLSTPSRPDASGPAASAAATRSGGVQEEEVAAARAAPTKRSPPSGRRPNPPAASPLTAVASGRIQRPVETAKFIAAEPASTGVDLGADGRLPQLVLTEAGKGDSREAEQPEQGRSVKPLLMVGVFCFSIVVSVILLFFDPSPPAADGDAKADARRQIEQHYVASLHPYPGDRAGEAGKTAQKAGAPAPGPKLEPYQLLLRQALQAYHRGDIPQERQRYREVLNLLHGEGKNQYAGLTGRLKGLCPSDEHLETLLSTLLR